MVIIAPLSVDGTPVAHVLLFLALSLIDGNLAVSTFEWLDSVSDFLFLKVMEQPISLPLAPIIMGQAPPASRDKSHTYAL